MDKTKIGLALALATGVVAGGVGGRATAPGPADVVCVCPDGGAPSVLPYPPFVSANIRPVMTSADVRPIMNSATIRPAFETAPARTSATP